MDDDSEHGCWVAWVLTLTEEKVITLNMKSCGETANVEALHVLCMALALLCLKIHYIV